MEIKNNGMLYIVATPIGNLEDITERAKKTLSSVSYILCEDTRNSGILLQKFEIKKPCISFHQHTVFSKFKEVLNLLQKGHDLALITDAGTPGVSDPGNELVGFLIKHGIRCVPIPGASALTSALSVCGFQTQKFLFLGFPPHKNKRKAFFESVRASSVTVVFFESCHRIQKALETLVELLPQDRNICICRELTKKFETVYYGTVSEIPNMGIPSKGEFVIVLDTYGS